MVQTTLHVQNALIYTGAPWYNPCASLAVIWYMYIITIMKFMFLISLQQLNLR